MTYNLIDNFLSKQNFHNLQECILNKPFPWYYVGFFVSKEELINDDSKYFHFSHCLYEDFTPTSPVGNKDILTPLIEMTNPIAIRNMVVHLFTRTPEFIPSTYHVDIGDIKDEPKKLEQWTTAILYVNTNNGYTKFEEDGSIVESVANRYVEFPANTRHFGTSCTDEKIRIVINYNYYK